jgi:chromosome segregation ATPase
MLQIFKKSNSDVAGIIASCKALPEVETLRATDARLSELHAAVVKIESAVAEVEAKRAALTVPRVPEVATARAELAAKVALGEAEAGELEVFDRKHAQARAEAEEAARRQRAALGELDATLAALNRRHEAATAEAGELSETVAGLRGAAVRAVAGRLGGRYVELLEVIAQIVSALHSLSALSSRADGLEFSQWAQRDGFPIFGLPALAERIVELNEAAKPLRGNTPEGEAALEALHAALAGIGIRC